MPNMKILCVLFYTDGNRGQDPANRMSAYEKRVYTGQNAGNAAMPLVVIRSSHRATLFFAKDDCKALPSLHASAQIYSIMAESQKVFFPPSVNSPKVASQP